MINLTPTECARLSDYVAHELPAHERADVEQWISEAPARQRFVSELRTGRFKGHALSGTDSGEIALHANRLTRDLAQLLVSERAQIEAVGRAQAPRYPRQYSRFSRVGLAALSLALVVTGWIIGQTSSIRSSHGLSVGNYVYITAPGKQATIVLPDGSTAHLNVASRLEVPTDYDRGNRTLRLTGEALLAVAPNKSDPFAIVSGSTVSRVLGTRFVVRHYPTDHAVTVAVQDGKVAVGSSVLAAMQQVQVNADGKSLVSEAQPGQFTFADGVLTLAAMPLATAIAELNRWYDIDIRLGDTALRSYRIGGKFASGSLADLVEVLEWTMKVNVVREGRVLTLYPREV